MLKGLKIILEIQEFDMKMIRLMQLKRERQKELENIESLRNDLTQQLANKEIEIADLNKNILILENHIQEIKEKIKKLETKQNSVKKVEEFNALTHEMTTVERERLATKQKASDLIDKRNMEEEILIKIKKSLKTSETSSKQLEKEIKNSIHLINEEGQGIKKQRDALIKDADPVIFKIYEKLLKNKKDRVVVPMENRTCSGCHIALTAQHENLARKGERLVFCEHCSRILYWVKSDELEGTTLAIRKRRRRKVTS